MRVLIIGLNHQIQSARIGWSSDRKAQAFMDDQKNRFAKLLRDEIRNRDVRFIGEEARHGDVSVAETVSRAEAIPYANIEMSPDTRSQASIPIGYNERMIVPDVDKARWNQQREQHMLNALIAGAGRAESVLAICGRMHVTPVATSLQRLGHWVEVSDLQDQDWYVEDWLDHML
jgi:hypothetical protein